MRVTPAMFVGLVALVTVSVQAAPNKANWVDLGVTPPLDLVAQSCGHNWLRTRLRDHWGYWHWGHCIPNARDHDGAEAVWDSSPGLGSLVGSAAQHDRGVAGLAVAEDSGARHTASDRDLRGLFAMISRSRSLCRSRSSRPKASSRLPAGLRR